MSLKRRGFLQLLGGALTAPLVPSATFATASKAAPSAAALHGAVYYAKTRVNFSVFTLAQSLGIPMEQAENLMVHMSERGMIGPLKGGNAFSGRWATSHLWRKPVAPAAAARTAAKTSSQSERKLDTETKNQAPNWTVDLRPFLSHLYKMAQSQGYTLHPRCQTLLSSHTKTIPEPY